MDKCLKFEDKCSVMKYFKNQISAVNEAAAVYVSGYSNYSIGKAFGIKEFINNKLLLIKSIRIGLSYAFFHEIKSITPFSDEDWADILNISTKSLQRYKQEQNFLFKPIHSEKIIEIAEVSLLGNEVFEDSTQFKLWLQTPNFALGNMQPLELLKDSYGKEMVMGELHRIDHGIFA